MTEVRLRDEQWGKVAAFLRETPKVYVGQERQCRRFVEGVLRLLRSGAQWRLLPRRYGRWNSVYKRFCRWSEHGVWKALFEHFATDPNMQSVMLDSSVVRAHACAAGASHEKGQGEQALGYSQGGFSTKVHVTVDALGNPYAYGSRLDRRTKRRTPKGYSKTTAPSLSWLTEAMMPTMSARPFETLALSRSSRLGLTA